MTFLGTCSPLTAPTNGEIDCSLGDDGMATDGDSCTFTCDDGFELQGDHTRECWVWWGRTGWTGHEAVCSERRGMHFCCITSTQK